MSYTNFKEINKNRSHAMTTRFKRLLKLRDIEFFNIIVNDDDRTAFLLIYDERRPQKKG